MTLQGLAIVVAATAAIAFGAGWSVNGSRWETKYQALEIDHANEQLQADTEARRRQAIAVAAASSIRDQPVRRVRCTSEPGDGVSSGRADAAVGALPTGGDSGDLGPALREALAVDNAVRALQSQPQ